MRSALYRSHARRKVFEPADSAGARRGARTDGVFNGTLRQNKPAPAISPVALEAVKRTCAIFDMRRAKSTAWTRLRATLQGRADAAHRSSGCTAGCSRSAPDCRNTTASPRQSTIRCPPEGDRWAAFTAFLDDGRICLTNNAAECALRGIASGRRSWLVAGSERGGEKAAFMCALTVSCKMNDIDPQAWMADVLARPPDITVSRLPELLPSKARADGARRASKPSGAVSATRCRCTLARDTSSAAQMAAVRRPPGAKATTAPITICRCCRTSALSRPEAPTLFLGWQ